MIVIVFFIMNIHVIIITFTFHLHKFCYRVFTAILVKIIMFLKFLFFLLDIFRQACVHIQFIKFFFHQTNYILGSYTLNVCIDVSVDKEYSYLIIHEMKNLKKNNILGFLFNIELFFQFANTTELEICLSTC